MIETEASNGFEIDLKVLSNHWSVNTSGLWLASPSNPTGAVLSKAYVTEAWGRVQSLGGHLLVDEIYQGLVYEGENFSALSIHDDIFVINSFSKYFAMTGWRLGYMGAPREIAAACQKVQGQNTSGANAFGQKAAAHALLSDMTPTYQMRDAFLRRRDMMIEKLREIPGFQVNHPQGAFYIFPDISSYFGKSDGQRSINNADEFCGYILSEAHVAVVSGSAFGADNCFRLSYAASEEKLLEAVSRIKKAMAKLS